MIETKPGTQIVYTPPHAKHDVNHPDCEHGFITGYSEDSVFCRFWLKGTYEPFKENLSKPELRTTSCSELCKRSDVVVMNVVEQKYVDSLVEQIIGIA